MNLPFNRRSALLRLLEVYQKRGSLWGLNEKGFSLVQLIVALGLVGGVTLLNVSLTKRRARIFHSTQTFRVIDTNMKLMASQLKDPIACFKTFGGANFKPMTNELIKAIKTADGKDFLSEETLSKDTDSYSWVRGGRMFLRSPVRTSPEDDSSVPEEKLTDFFYVKPDGNIYNGSAKIRYLNLEVSWKRPGLKQGSDSEVNESLSLRFVVNSEGKMLSCGISQRYENAMALQSVSSCVDKKDGSCVSCVDEEARCLGTLSGISYDCRTNTCCINTNPGSYFYYGIYYERPDNLVCQSAIKI